MDQLGMTEPEDKGPTLSLKQGQKRRPNKGFKKSGRPNSGRAKSAGENRSGSRSSNGNRPFKPKS